MKDTIIIKLFRPEFQRDFLNLNNENFERRLRELKDYAKQIEKEILFTVNIQPDCAHFDCIGEIKYHYDLSIFEKQRYIDLIRYFARNAKVINGNICEYDLPVRIFYNKTSLELHEA